MEELVIKINLQLFANPEDEGRTEQPTEKKLREAREKGKVAKTTELSSALVLVVSFVILALIGKTFLSNIIFFMRYIFSNIGSLYLDNSKLKYIGVDFVVVFFKIVSPLLLGAVVVAVIADVVQVGFQFTLHPLKPELSKISFTFEKFVNRILFSRQVFVNLLKSVLKISIIVIIAFLITKSDFGKIIKTIHLGLSESLSIIAWTVFKIILWVSVVMIVFSGFDYMYQKYEHIQSLKMTIHEIKEERKQYEGDPLIKSRQRERHRELAMRRMMQQVPKADVIVTNPTHYAVALLYDESYMNAAQVVAKGVDLIALKIIKIAKANDVPVIENRLLARTLYNEVEIGDEIPAHLYEAVANLLVFVYRMKKEAG